MIKKLKTISIIVIVGLFIAGVANAYLSQYWKTVKDFLPRTDNTVDIGSPTKKVKDIYTSTLTTDTFTDGTLTITGGDLDTTGTGRFDGGLLDTWGDMLIEPDNRYIYSAGSDAWNDNLSIKIDDRQLISANGSPDDVILDWFTQGIADFEGNDIRTSGSIGTLAYPISSIYADSFSDGSLTITGGEVYISGSKFLSNTGTENVFLGVEAGTTGDYGTFVGFEAGKNNTGDSNTYIGNWAGYGDAGGSSGTGNVAIGLIALQNITTGHNNVALGSAALNSLTEGNYNMAIGENALRCDTDGSYNVAIGSTALNNTTGTENVGIGRGAGYRQEGGDYNTMIGSLIASEGGGGDFSNNTIIGHSAAINLVTGSNSVIIGKGAGNNLQTGDGNIFIGYQAGASETGSNTLYIDNSNTVTPLIYGDFATNELTINGSLITDSFSDGTLTITGGGLTTTGTGTFGSLVVDTNTLVVNAAGYTDKVGIGTATPDEKLQVLGNLHIGQNTADPVEIFVQGINPILRFDGVGGSHTGITYDSGKIFQYGDGVVDVLRVNNAGSGSQVIFSSRDEAGAQIIFSPRTARAMTIEDDGNVGIGTAAPDTKLQVVGDVKIGDDNTNYLNIANNGQITLAGDARVYNYVRVAAAEWKKGANAPADAYVGAFHTINFSQNQEDSGYFTLVAPFRMEVGSNIDIEVHWTHNNASTNEVTWGIEWACLSEGDTLGGATTTETLSSGQTVQRETQHDSFITGIPGCVAGDDLGIRFFRDQDDPEDNLAAVAELMAVHFHFISDSLGQPINP